MKYKQNLLRFLHASAILTVIGISVLSFKFYSANRISFVKPDIFYLQPKTSPVAVVNAEVVSPVPLDSNEIYMCRVFSDQCRVALQIAHLENGTGQCDRVHVNSNNSWDIGTLQVNSVHIGQVIDGHKITLAELVTCKGNTDDAYLIQKHSGWNAWTTYKLLPNNLK